MKLFVAILSVLSVLSLALAEDYETCDKLCDTFAKDSSKGLPLCNAKYGALTKDGAIASVQAYVNEQLESSYDYLLMSTYYNSYKKERPGLSKLFRSLSDDTFENSIKLIKQLTKRGGVADFTASQERQGTTDSATKTLEVDELIALGKALDVEKRLATRAHNIHKEFAHENRYDPEFGHFMEEEFLDKQSSNVRKLTGYVNDLSRILDLDTDKGIDSQARLGAYLFDEYLEKQ